MPANFMWLPNYPVWGLIIIAIDVLVIWALSVHGRDFTRFLIDDRSNEETRVLSGRDRKFVGGQATLAWSGSPAGGW